MRGQRKKPRIPKNEGSLSRTARQWAGLTKTQKKTATNSRRLAHSRQLGWNISCHPYAKIGLVEGGADLIAALHFIFEHGREGDVFPVAMLGAKQRIHADALPYFSGKRVRIFAHADEAGRDGAEGWARQLEAVGCEVDCFSFEGLRKADGSPVKDLNDCTQICLENAKELEGLLP